MAWISKLIGDYSFSSKRSTGANWGGYLGSKAGQFIGGGAQRLLMGAIGGLGDYKVRKNIFLSGKLPEVRNHPGGGGLVLSFQEFIGDVITSPTAGAFKLESWMLNAANSNLFPFLSQIASNYEQYEFEGVVFAFQTRSGDALSSTNTALGSVMMATQYDSYDAPFTNKGEMLNYEYSSSGKPSDNTVHMIECDPNQSGITVLYTLYDADPPQGADKRLYNLGRFSLATVGFQGASVNIGELHVTYQVRLLKPKLFMTLTQNAGFYLSDMSLNASSIYTDALPLGGISPTFSIDTIGIVRDATHLTIPASTTPIHYRMEIFWLGSTQVAFNPPTVSITGGTITSGGNTPNTGTNTQSAAQFLTLTGPGSSVPMVVTYATDGILPTNPGGILSRLIIRIMEVPFSS